MRNFYLLGVTTPSKEVFDQAVEEVLKKSKYLFLRNQYKEMIEKMKETIIKWIKDILSNMEFGGNKIQPSSASISKGLMITGIVFSIMILIILFIYIRKMVRKDTKIKHILGEVIDEQTTTETLNEKARKYKAHGDYREAVRYSFIAILFHMNEKNILYLDESMTNKEMVKSLRKNNFKQVTLFEDLVHLFNKA